VDHQTGKEAAPACGTGTHRDRSLPRGLVPEASSKIQFERNRSYSEA